MCFASGLFPLCWNNNSSAVKSWSPPPVRNVFLQSHEKRRVLDDIPPLHLEVEASRGQSGFDVLLSPFCSPSSSWFALEVSPKIKQRLGTFIQMFRTHWTPQVSTLCTSVRLNECIPRILLSSACCCCLCQWNNVGFKSNLLVTKRHQHQRRTDPFCNKATYSRLSLYFFFFYYYYNEIWEL